jgi:ParB/RepB/Spo0J family partition protein
MMIDDIEPTGSEPMSGDIDTITPEQKPEAQEAAEASSTAPPEPQEPWEQRTIPIKYIDVDLQHRLRRCKEDAVKKLKESIQKTGLLQPILVTVRRQRGSRCTYRLRAGFHRLEACKRLEWKEIPALISKLTGPRAELIEVDENLMQTALTPAERAKFTARRKEIYLVLNPDTAKGKAQGEGKKRSLSEAHGTERKVYAEIDNQTPKSFVEDTAEKTGRSKRSIELDAERAEKIAPDVMEEISGTPLDQGTVLDGLKSLSHEEQRERVKEMKAAPAKTRGGGKSKGKSLPKGESIEHRDTDTFDTKLAEQLEKAFADLWQLSMDLQKPEIRNVADRIERALAAKGIVKASERMKDSGHYLRKLKPSREQSEQSKVDKEASPPPQPANNNEALQQEAG